MTAPLEGPGASRHTTSARSGEEVAEESLSRTKIPYATRQPLRIFRSEVASERHPFQGLFYLEFSSMCQAYSHTR